MLFQLGSCRRGSMCSCATTFYSATIFSSISFMYFFWFFWKSIKASPVAMPTFKAIKSISSSVRFWSNFGWVALRLTRLPGCDEPSPTVLFLLPLGVYSLGLFSSPQISASSGNTLATDKSSSSSFTSRFIYFSVVEQDESSVCGTTFSWAYLAASVSPC